MNPMDPGTTPDPPAGMMAVPGLPAPLETYKAQLDARPHLEWATNPRGCGLKPKIDTMPFGDYAHGDDRS